MALVKCKECGKEKSEYAKVCPHCGFKENRKKLSKKVKIILLVTIILTSLSAFFISLNYYKGQKNIAYTVSSMIDLIGDVDENSCVVIEEAEKKYQELTNFQKSLVKNYKNLQDARITFNNLPIKLNKDNIKQFLSFEFEFTDFHKDIDFLLDLTYYNATANMIVRTANLKNVSYENLIIKIKCNIEGGVLPMWNEPEVTLRIPNNGITCNTTPLKYSTIFGEADAPRLHHSLGYEITSVQGLAYNN